jgi:hypothetical protein
MVLGISNVAGFIGHTSGRIFILAVVMNKIRAHSPAESGCGGSHLGHGRCVSRAVVIRNPIVDRLDQILVSGLAEPALDA